MKIAMVNVYFYPDMVGGAEWYVYNISRELVKMGNEVHVFTSKYSKSEMSTYPSEIEGVKIQRLPLIVDLSHKLKLWKGLKEAIVDERPDIVHTFDYAQLHSYSALRVASILKCPLILTVFDVHSLIPRPWYKQMLMKAFDRISTKFVLVKADKVLVRASTLVQPILKMGVQENRLIVTPSGIRPEALDGADSSYLVDKYNVSRPIVLYLGRINPLKGLEHLLRAAPSVLKEFPTTTFVFVGPDWNNYTAYLRQIAKGLGILERVIFTGPIYDLKEKMNAYASCDVFVLPSGYEGTSQSVFEAMAQGRPIVSTRSGGIPYQVEDGKEALLVEFGDERDLAYTISKFLADDAVRIKLGKNAKEKVKQFTYPLLAKQIEGIYRASLEEAQHNDR